MKEIVNVSISGIAFTVDKECYAMLNNFLQTTTKERGSDITAEVEASIAEQILSVQSADRPVSMPLLQDILERIGGVDLSSTPITDEPTSTRPKITKRLYRKGQGSIVGGVCNGMATYFNVHVALIRIYFLVPFIFSFSMNIWHWYPVTFFTSGFSGTVLMLYIILWIVIPKARTARQELEMEGEDITVDSLERKAGQSSHSNNSSTSNALGTILRVFGVIIGSVIMLSSIAAVIGMLFGTQFAYSNNTEGFSQVYEVTGLSLRWFQLWASLVIMLPAIGLFYLLLSSAFGRVRGWIAGIIFTVWILLLLAAGVWMAIHAPELIQLDGRYNFDWDSHHCRSLCLSLV